MSTNQKTILGFIGGSGIYNLELLKEVEEISVSTPFGKPSDNIIAGKLDGKKVVFLPRHGRGHRFLPSEVNYRANIYALKKVGVTNIISISAVGSLQESFAPGSILIPDQIFDFTKGLRANTFFGGGVVGHVSFAQPFCEYIRSQMQNVCKSLKLNFHFGGTYVCIEGPRFSSRAESHNFREIGGSIIGMTAMPEAILAREAELPYANISFVTDFDCWRDEHEAVNVEMVLETLRKNGSLAQDLTAEITRSFSENETNPIFNAAQHAIMTEKRLIPDETKEKLNLLYGKYWK